MRSCKRASLLILSMLISLPAVGQDPFAVIDERLSRIADSHLEQLKVGNPSEMKKENESRADPPDDVIRTLSALYWKGREDNLRNAIKRVQNLSPVIAPILRRQGLPQEMLAVVLIESAGNTNAVSKAGALGAWQLMPLTARQYGLGISPDKDERLSLEKATLAAARHMRDLFERFGSWELAFAAYNAGPTAVQRSLDRRKSGEYRDIAYLLPPETRLYVPAVLQAVKIFGNGGALPEWTRSRSPVDYATGTPNQISNLAERTTTK